jgi:alpha-glucosidase (family GH31 glycosyl hydrolase)
MYFTMKINLLEDEYWWGGANDDGPVMPFHSNCHYTRELDPNNSYNQAAPLLLSSKGRYIWCESGFGFSFAGDDLILTGTKEKPQLFDGFDNLRGAYLAASQKFFATSKKSPPKNLFDGIQYNSWIELTYNQNQTDILNYARKIKETGMPCSGVFMIDCGWNDYYGKFEFSTLKFSDPKSMVDELHSLGFKVMLWNCPFLSADTSEFRYTRDRGYLVTDKNGNPSIKQWWDGHSAVLDFTNPDAVNWYKEQNQKLMDKYGIDGFKLDAGDAHFYSDDDITYLPTDSNGQSEAWAMFGLCYDYNEYRTSWKCGGQALVQRLRDKDHTWDNNGVCSLVPSQIAQGIIGISYTCPDMIGGGQFDDFWKKADFLDQELFVRYAQCAALMPMMQFSAAPWRVLDEKHFNLCKEAAWLHMEYAPIILDLVEHAQNTGEPIIRYMEYVFPDQGLETITDQFMLGDNILVAPVMSKGKTEREVAFPAGRWEDTDGNVLEGGKTLFIDAPLEKLPIFKKRNV